MSDQPSEWPSRQDILSTRAELEAAAEAIKGMRASNHVPSTLLDLLEACADVLDFVLNHPVYLESRDEDYALLALLSADEAWEHRQLTAQLVSILQGIPGPLEGPLDGDGVGLTSLSVGGRFSGLIGETLEMFDRSLVLFSSALDATSGIDDGSKQRIEEKFLAAKAKRASFGMWRAVLDASGKAIEAADAAAEAAGGRSEQTLSDDFDELARKEGIAANIFRAITLALFAGVTGYAAMVAYSAPEPTVEMAQKLAIGIPALLLAGYCAKEGGQHRRTARWAAVRGVQLRSVRAYTISMTPEDASSLRLGLGQRAFFETPDGQQTAADSSGDAVPHIEPALIREVADLVRAAQQK